MNDIDSLAVARGRKALEAGVLPGPMPHFLFVTISGAHLYGFPSVDSDIDLRGAHVLPADSFLGLQEPEQTFQSTKGSVDGIEIDCVSHDIRKYIRLLAKKNGYVLEQIFSPLVVRDIGFLDELRTLARGALTRHIVHHYKGFFQTQHKLVLKQPPCTAKSMLYLFRVAMTGLYLLRTHQVEANILALNETMFRFAFIPELVERKISGQEKGRLPEGDAQNLLAEALKLESQLDAAAEISGLPEEVQNVAALNDFLLRVRKQAI